MPSGASPTALSRGHILVAGTVLTGLIVLAYANTFSAPFVFDDLAAVTQNPSIEHFSTALHPPAGLSVTGRPLVNLTLALNYAVSGRAVWSYHVLNLALHIACALTLYALIRRSLPLSDAQRTSAIAFTTALLWALHPLQTASVTYIMQRSEELVSLCLLLTLYAFARALKCHPIGDTTDRSPAVAQAWPGGFETSKFWLAVSVAACLCGMAAKEVMVSAPPLVLLYDRTFVAKTFQAALRARTLYYCSLATTWVALCWLVFATENRGASAGLAAGMAWTEYALTQIYAVAHYLRLALWPAPLVFDYGTSLIRNPALIVSSAVLIVALLAVAAFALRRWPAVGFCGVFFFALLAPSSSVVPIATQTMAEHRIYLALAAPLVLAAVALQRRIGRSPRFVAVTAAAGFACITFARNADYRSEIALWRDTVIKAPHNARAHYNLGASLLANAGAAATQAAIAEFRETLRLDPTHPFAPGKLGAALLAAGQVSEALPLLATAVQRDAASAAAHYDFALALVQLGRIDEASRQLAETIHLAPTHAAAHYNLGNALTQLGHYTEALAEFNEASRLDPQDASARANAARLREFIKP